MSTGMFSSRLETFSDELVEGRKACYGIPNRWWAFYCIPHAVNLWTNLCQFKYCIIVIYYVLAYC